MVNLLVDTLQKCRETLTGNSQYISGIGTLVRRHISRTSAWDGINRIFGLHFREYLFLLFRVYF